MKKSLPKSSRLLKKIEFDIVKSRSKKLIGNLVFINYLKSNHNKRRLGIIVTKRYGKAFKRNRFKRIAREVFRLNQHKLPSGVDILIRPIHNKTISKEQDVSKEFNDLISHWTN